MEEVRSEENEKSKPMTICKKINGERDHSNDENFSLPRSKKNHENFARVQRYEILIDRGE